MSSTKIIKSKIKSIKNTEKITSAMQMVATAKMRHVLERLLSIRPYASNIARMASNLLQLGDYALFDSKLLRKVDNIRSLAIVLVTTDKGLCGGINNNILKLFYEQVLLLKKNGLDISLYIIGHKGFLAAKRSGLNITAVLDDIGDNPSIAKINQVTNMLLKQYYNEEIDQIQLFYTHFITRVRQEPNIKSIMPIDNSISSVEKKDMSVEYMYEPSAGLVLDALISRYVEYSVYQCVLDNIASEQASRMLAMQSASDNAKDIVKTLRLEYNKFRQESITRELAEIISGLA